MKYLIVIYNSASFVASLWCLSAITPLLLFVANDIYWMSIVAVGLIILYGSSISLFSKEKITQGCWCKSDVFAYIVVPACLFTYVTYMMLSSVNA
ncbi:hypothetical protein [Colwellia hornerae]|uniref:Uncharacterized protein n=1 Tax=Colwellia hornerae TaxID=89402 RepID=A0A5C6Q745_9GAMM|nr:hypothetical protein [Colwellia hornerae]TWX49221.1 hypothetical protein ESZ28_15765 [Colwellia hornerae]TWX55813.1 hypothetical protein ESZ26_15730 [Colwellia hornerae]TWX64683.1 hypothetical protein ESZ27_13785 [Colwellia hornerae]